MREPTPVSFTPVGAISFHILASLESKKTALSLPDPRLESEAPRKRSERCPERHLPGRMTAAEESLPSRQCSLAGWWSQLEWVDGWDVL